MAIERKVPGEIRIFLNHVYEFKKGIRNMVLYTMNKEHEAFAIQRLEKQNISYLIQEVNTNKINLFFGKNLLLMRNEKIKYIKLFCCKLYDIACFV